MVILDKQGIVVMVKVIIVFYGYYGCYSYHGYCFHWAAGVGVRGENHFKDCFHEQKINASKTVSSL
jgi:hypothetical protein